MLGDYLPAGDDGQRELTLQLLEVLTGWPAWRALRDEQGCSVMTARAVLTRGLHRALFSG